MWHKAMDSTKYLPSAIIFSNQCSTKQSNYFHAFLLLEKKNMANGDTYSATIRMNFHYHLYLVLPF